MFAAGLAGKKSFLLKGLLLLGILETTGDGVVTMGDGVETVAGAGETAGVLSAGALVKGWPTEISHRWPGWPCLGFSFTPVVVVVAGVLTAGVVLEVAGLLTVGVAAVLLAGTLFSGWPTAISHRCPGCPCLGLMLTPLAAVVDVLVIGVVLVVTVWLTACAGLAGALLSGWPTAKSHRCPG